MIKIADSRLPLWQCTLRLVKESEVLYICTTFLLRN